VVTYISEQAIQTRLQALHKNAYVMSWVSWPGLANCTFSNNSNITLHAVSTVSVAVVPQEERPVCWLAI
jgi:hypothetical protein